MFIGRQFKLISSLEVTNYAVEYLKNNPNVNNEFLELAWEQAEDKVDDILERIISDSSSEDMTKEYHKWLYSIIKLGGLFEEIKNDMVERNLAERLWEMFDELIQIVIVAISESGVVDLNHLKNQRNIRTLKTYLRHPFREPVIFEG